VLHTRSGLAHDEGHRPDLAARDAYVVALLLGQRVPDAQHPVAVRHVADHPRPVGGGNRVLGAVDDEDVRGHVRVDVAVDLGQARRGERVLPFVALAVGAEVERVAA
jgi:hypothetical protein